MDVPEFPYYFRNRYLDPYMGRFLTPDPSGIWKDLANLGNGYTYAGNNPHSRLDPFAMETFMPKNLDKGWYRNESFLMQSSITMARYLDGIVGAAKGLVWDAPKAIAKDLVRANGDPLRVVANKMQDLGTLAGTYYGDPRLLSEGVQRYMENFDPMDVGELAGNAAFAFATAGLGAGEGVAQGASGLRNAGAAMRCATKGRINAVHNVFRGKGKLPLPTDFCFVAGTIVATPEGDRPIEDIQEGDLVWAFNHHWARWEASPVVIVSERQYTGVLVTIDLDGESITCTPEHPFWVAEGEDLGTRPLPSDVPARDPDALLSGRYVDAKDLRPGDVLLALDPAEPEESVRIDAVRLHGEGETRPVYNFEVAGFHTYAVGDTAALVHNANCPRRGTTRFVDGARVVDRRTGQVLEGTVDLKPTLDRIKSGGSFPHRNDGSVFRNREGLLPSRPEGYYREFVHPSPGVRGPGPQRVVQGQGGELFYTPDHYGTFIPLN